MNAQDELAKFFARDIEYAFQVAKGYGYRIPSKYAVGVTIRQIRSHTLQIHLRIDDELASVYLDIPQWGLVLMGEALQQAKAFREGIAGAASTLVLQYLDNRSLSPEQRIAVETLKRSDEEIHREAVERMRSTVFSPPARR